VTAASGRPRGSRPVLVVLPTDEVPGAAAEVIARSLAAAIDARGVAHWSTTGGSAAPEMYRALLDRAAAATGETVDWSRVHVWWGDDRFVPADHPLSNVLPFEELLMAPGSGGRSSGITIPRGQVHPIPVAEAIAEGAVSGTWGPSLAAERYAASLRDLVPADAAGTPILDLLVLGVGPDGHVMSVFPGSATWVDPASCSAVPAPAHVEPHVARVTMNPRVIAAAREVLVVVPGGSKAGILAEAWSGDDVRELPVRATMIPAATWVLDEAAAAGLPRP
jgi:6-phosphogluconolactonase